MTDSPRLAINARAAAILCGKPDFQQFLAHKHRAAWEQSQFMSHTERAAAVLRVACGIESRTQLDTDPDARRRYDQAIGLPYSTWRSRASP